VISDARIYQPTSLAEALCIRAEHPPAEPIHGGTDLMVEVNFGRRAPAAYLDLTRIPELSAWSDMTDRLVIGAGVTHTALMSPEIAAATSLAEAARTVGSPQIRNRGTLGGNLATASPAGDAIPPLRALDATVVLASTRGERRLPIGDFIVGPKQTNLAADELITAVEVPRRGAQTFMKIGQRNAMVIAVTSLAMAVDDVPGTVRVAYGSAGPVVGLVELPIDERADLPEAVAEACTPINDVRGTAAYRRHALRVLTTRALRRCFP
jgi:CO/xanthine dehydrogenase FAD-binding subunit